MQYEEEEEEEDDDDDESNKSTVNNSIKSTSNMTVSGRRQRSWLVAKKERKVHLVER